MRSIHLSAFALLLSFLLSAQGLQAQFISFGPRVGVSMSSLERLPSGVRDATYRTGLLAGGFVRLKVPVLGLFVQPELLYAQSGGRYTSLTGEQVDLRVNSIDVPLLLGIQLVRVFRVYGGPVFGQVIDARTETGGVSTSVPDLNNNLRSVMVGFGFNLSRLELDLRFVSRGNPIASTSSTRMGGFQLSAAYRLRTKGKSIWRKRFS